MPRPTVLSISSQVAYGHVGNSAIIAALHTHGCTVIDIPTIILSSHPGHGPAASIEVSAEKIDEFLDILGDQGRLDTVDAVVSGYFRNCEQIASVKKAVERVKAKNPAALFCCDPVIGDDLPGMYVPQSVAEAIKTDLIPLSDMLTPNLFEFQFLLGQKVTDLRDCIDKVRQNFKCPVLVSSVPADDPAHCGTLLVLAEEAWLCTAERIDKVPHGTGDLLTGLFVGSYLATRSYQKALSSACGQLNVVLLRSIAEGCDELVLSHLMAASLPPDFPPARSV